MVGVPRSKGCRICVTRRVKCDLRRPTCKNCEKGNRPCPGYDQDLKFQDEGVKLRKRFGQQDPDAGEPSGLSFSDFDATESSQLQVRKSSPFDKLLRTDPVPYRNSFFSLLERNKFVDAAAVLDTDFMRDEMIATAWLNGGRMNFDETFDNMSMGPMLFTPYLAQEQLLDIFTTSISASGQKTALPRGMQNHTRWLSHLPPLTGRDALLDTAIRAVSLAHLGRLHGSDQFLNESRPYYGKALRLLASSIADKQKGMASETLSATILLSFYEMFSSDSNDSWIQHAGGAGALMKSRGPAQHREGFDREIFLAYRHTIIIESFQKDEACFLNEPEWLELSHQVHEDMRNSGIPPERLELFDIVEEFYLAMVAIPEVFQDVSKLRNMRKDTIDYGTLGAFKIDIMRRAHQHRTTMKTLFARFRAILTKVDIAPSTYVSGDLVIPIYYHYVNIFIGSAYTGHWTIMMVLNMILMELEKPTNPESAALYRAENRETGLEICRSTTYMLTSSFLGPFFIVFGLRMCLVVFELPEERDWVVQRLFEIGNTHMRMASHIPGFHPGTGMPRVRAAIAKTDAKRLEEVS